MDDALAVLDALDVPQSAIFGISEGGSAATMLAAAHPDRVSAMVQYGTYARLAQADDHPEGIPVDRLKAFWSRLSDDWVDPSTIDSGLRVARATPSSTTGGVGSFAQASAHAVPGRSSRCICISTSVRCWRVSGRRP